MSDAILPEYADALLAMSLAKVKHHQFWAINFAGLAAVNLVCGYLGDTDTLLSSMCLWSSGYSFCSAIGEFDDYLDTKKFKEAIEEGEVSFGMIVTRSRRDE